MTKYVFCRCGRCRRQYWWWKDRGIYASRKYCPDCNIILGCKAIHLEEIESLAGPDPEGREDKRWVERQMVKIAINIAGLTEKQKKAVKKYLKEGKVPKRASRSYYLAIEKMRKAAAGIFR